MTAVENTHFNFQPGTPPYGKYHSYSYRVETPGRVVFFTGDTGPSDAVVDLAKGADVYVTEVTSVDEVVEQFKRTGAWDAKTKGEQDGFIRHMHEEHVTPAEVGQMAAKAGVKTVVMTHFGPSVDSERRLSALRRRGEEIFFRPDHARQGLDAVLMLFTSPREQGEGAASPRSPAVAVTVRVAMAVTRAGAV